MCLAAIASSACSLLLSTEGGRTRDNHPDLVVSQHGQVLLYLDKRIGEFVDMLEQEGWLENSVIVVSSDNGACPDDGGSNYPLRGVKQSVFEGGSRVSTKPCYSTHQCGHAGTVWISRR